MMLDLNFGIKNIIEAHGFSIALTGMLIVFVALGLITLFIVLLPKILEVLSKVLPPEEGMQVELAAESDEILAAIGYVLHRSITKHSSEK